MDVRIQCEASLRVPAVCSDMSTFFDDLKTVRPTSMALIPRIANMMHDQVQEEIRKAQSADKQVRMSFMYATI